MHCLYVYGTQYKLVCTIAEFGFERVEPSLRAGPPFWADAAHSLDYPPPDPENRVTGLLVPLGAVKPGTHVAMHRCAF